MKRCLVLKEEGIGNAVMLTPLLPFFKKHYDSVDILCSERNYEVLKGHPCANAVYKVGDALETVYDICYETVFTSHSLRGKARYQKLIEHRDIDFRTRHETDHNFDLLDRMGVPNDRSEPVSLPIPPKRFRLPTKKKRVAIHIGCLNHQVWRNRLWPVQYWVELAETLERDFDASIILVGGTSDFGFYAPFLKSYRGEYRNYIGELNIKETTALIGKCDLFLSIDSGVMHLASCTGIKQIALFGPTSEIKSHPWTDDSTWKMLRVEDLECKRCYIEDKPLFFRCENNRCMQELKPEAVLSVIETRGWL